MAESDSLKKISKVIRLLNLLGKIYLYLLILVIVLFVGFLILGIDSPLPELSENMTLFFLILNSSLLPFFILIAIAEYILSKKGYWDWIFWQIRKIQINFLNSIFTSGASEMRIEFQLKNIKKQKKPKIIRKMIAISPFLRGKPQFPFFFFTSFIKSSIAVVYEVSRILKKDKSSEKKNKCKNN